MALEVLDSLARSSPAVARSPELLELLPCLSRLLASDGLAAACGQAGLVAPSDGHTFESAIGLLCLAGVRSAWEARQEPYRTLLLHGRQVEGAVAWLRRSLSSARISSAVLVATHLPALITGVVAAAFGPAAHGAPPDAAAAHVASVQAAEQRAAVCSALHGMCALASVAALDLPELRSLAAKLSKLAPGADAGSDVVREDHTAQQGAGGAESAAAPTLDTADSAELTTLSQLMHMCLGSLGSVLRTLHGNHPAAFQRVLPAHDDCKGGGEAQSSSSGGARGQLAAQSSACPAADHSNDGGSTAAADFEVLAQQWHTDAVVACMRIVSAPDAVATGGFDEAIEVVHMLAQSDGAHALAVPRAAHARVHDADEASQSSAPTSPHSPGSLILCSAVTSLVACIGYIQAVTANEETKAKACKRAAQDGAGPAALCHLRETWAPCNAPAWMICSASAFETCVRVLGIFTSIAQADKVGGPNASHGSVCGCGQCVARQQQHDWLSDEDVMMVRCCS